MPGTNAGASGMVVNGATAKPTKAPAGVTSSDGDRTESSTTRASALADAGDVAKRGFTPVVRTDAPGTGNNDTSKPAPTAAAPQTPQHDAANPATVAATTTAPAVEPAPAAPAHGQTAPVPPPDPGVSIATVNSGPPATQTAAPAHIAVQIQVSQQASDLNTLAVTIAARSEAGQKHFDIRLDPADLGRVDVRLTVDDAGKAQALLTVEKPQTLELLQKDQGHLERALKDAGLDLGQNGLSFSLKGQQQQQQQNAAQDHTPFARGQRLTARAVAAVDDIPPTLSASSVGIGDTRLDIRV